MPLKAVVRLDPPAETVELAADTSGLDLDFVTHDVRKFFALMLKKNGYVLEQVLLDADDIAFHEQEFQRLYAELEAAHHESRLPEVPSARAALNDLLTRIRLKESTWLTTSRRHPGRRAVRV